MKKVIISGCVALVTSLLVTLIFRQFTPPYITGWISAVFFAYVFEYVKDQVK